MDNYKLLALAVLNFIENHGYASNSDAMGTYEQCRFCYASRRRNIYFRQEGKEWPWEIQDEHEKQCPLGKLKQLIRKNERNNL